MNTTMIRVAVLACASALLTTQAHAADMKQAQVKATTRKMPTGLRPDRGYTLSKQKPLLLKPTGTAESWGQEQHVWIEGEQPSSGGGGPRRDPYRLRLQHFNAGTTIDVKRELAPDPVQVPSGDRIVLKQAASRQRVNAKYNRALRAAVAAARKEAPLTSAVAPGPSSSQDTVIENPSALATKSHLIVRGTDPNGRKYQALRMRVDGTKDVRHETRQAGYISGGVFFNDPRYGMAKGRSDRVIADVTSGRLAPVEPLYIQRKNLWVTPVFEEAGARAAGRSPDGKATAATPTSFVKLMGLAAFPRKGDAIVFVTNTRLEGEGAAAHIWEFKQNGMGGGSLKVPAKLGDKLRVTVFDNPAVGGTRKPAPPVTTEIVIPKGGKNGVEYIRVEPPVAAEQSAKTAP